MVIAVGASVLRTNRFEQSNSGYSIVKVFVNGDNVRALLEMHLKQIGFEYPGIKLFDA